MKDQITLGPEHHAHHMRNRHNPFYRGSAAVELDRAIGIMGTAIKSEVRRDAMGRVVKSEEPNEPVARMRI